VAKIPPPSAPHSDKKIINISFRLSGEDCELFKHTLLIYKQIHKSNYKTREVSKSDVIRAALVVFRKELLSEFQEIARRDSLTDEELEEFSKYISPPPE